MRPITGETKLLAVIGHPIAHSLSPQIHNRFADDFELPYAYLAFDVEPDKLTAWIDAARVLNVTGFNVTMPLKERILPYIDEIDDEAERYGAVNTVVLRDGKFYGHNTDGYGFTLSLERAGYSFEGQALVLGIGGAAKAVAIALTQKGMRVRMATRRMNSLPSHAPGVDYCKWEDVGNIAKECTLIVNATPLGMEGVGEQFGDLSFLQALPHEGVVYDLIYSPRKTLLLREAEAKGLKTLNGLSHLVYQAAQSFCFFTGQFPAERTIGKLLTL